MTEQGLRLERDGGVARIVLDRPSKGNAIDLAAAKALLDAAITCDEEDGVRCVMLTGEGRLFCAGGDIAAFAAAGDRLAHFSKELTAALHMAISRLARMGKPLVTAINGPAGGAGLSLAVLGDIALAARSAHFTLAYSRIGFSPDAGATWLLPRLIGLRRTQEMALLNKRVSAAEAAAIGLVTRVVDDDALAAEADAVATELAQSATYALGRTRQLLADAMGANLEQQMEAEARAVSDTTRQPHAREGIAAFLNKRKPKFD